MELIMPFPKTLCFVFGVLVGVAGFFWSMLGGIAPPSPQETSRIEVGIAKLKPEDQWLEKVHFQIVPLNGVRSLSGYAILLMTPPPGGVHPPTASGTTLDLTASTAFWTTIQTSGSYSFPEGIQPIGIGGGDFGANGDQPVLKFIDEEFRTDRSSYYHQGQRLMIGSDPNP
jgi:hypothetical protein